MKLDYSQKEALRKFASGLIVLAGTVQDGEDIAQACESAGLSEGQVRTALTCMHAFPDVPTPDEDPTDRHAAMKELFREITGNGMKLDPPGTGRYSAQEDRLVHCLMSIPEWTDYAVLMRDYTGKWPAGPRQGRPDDRPDYDMTRRGTFPVDTDANCIARAMKHLCHPARINYMVCDYNDIPEVPARLMGRLHEKHVYVKADFDRFQDRDLLLAFCDDTETLGLVCALRAAAAMTKRS